MPKSPEYLLPEEQARAQTQRATSDAELIKGGAEFIADDSGNIRLEVTSEQIENARKEMEAAHTIEKEQVAKKVQEIAHKKFSIDYLEEVVRDNEAPESYVWNGRRILRSTLQTLVEELQKTGAVNKKERGWESNKAGGIQELETQDPSYIKFVDALNAVMRRYDDLFDGSDKIIREHWKLKK